MIVSRPPSSPLFPYTTLFRSSPAIPVTGTARGSHPRSEVSPRVPAEGRTAGSTARGTPRSFSISSSQSPVLRLKQRSEEHTSELQSRLHLVCRLLLEKKKHEA